MPAIFSDLGGFDWEHKNGKESNPLFSTALLNIDLRANGAEVRVVRIAVFMKKQISIGPRLAVIGFMVAAVSAINVTAQDASKATTAPNSAETAAVSQTTTVRLSPGVPDVLKLVQSKIGDDTIIAFINNSAATYSLGASEIIYLREQGVSDSVITAMLNQHSNTPVATAPVTTAAVATAPASTAPMATAPADPAQSSTAYAPAAPAYTQPSTVYVAPPAPAYGYYPDYYSSYYYPYYGDYYPPVSLSFGFGFGGHRGGFHGGGFHGGHRRRSPWPASACIIAPLQPGGLGMGEV